MALAPMAAGSAPGTVRIDPSSGELADRGVAGDRVGRDGLHGDHHGEHDRQVELAALLRQVGGREVHRHVAVGHAETDGVQRVTHALAAFGHRLVGQPDDDERGLARRDAHLHLDRARLDADESERGDLAVHARAMAPLRCTRNVSRARDRMGKLYLTYHGESGHW
jgi:hypothetical protein